MLFQRSPGVGHVVVSAVVRHPEVLFNKLAQVESRLVLHPPIVDQDIQRVLLWRAVGEGFAVGKDA